MGFLKDTVIAITGTLPHSTKEIQGWISRNGGTYSPNITEHVTHLLSSKEAYKSRNETVQQAMSLDIHILSYDWFDDSLQARRKLGTTRYLWEVLRKERRVSKQLKRAGPQADALSFRKGFNEIKELTGTGTCDTVARRKPRKSKSFFFSSASSPSPATCVPDTPFVSAKEDLLRRRVERVTDQEEAEAESQAAPARGFEHEDTSTPTFSTSNPKLTSPPCVPTSNSSPRIQAKITHWKDAYHYYRDVTGFEYKICLLRSDFSCNGVAKYYIGLLESHAKPHVYWTILHYQPAKKGSSTPNDDSEDSKKDATTPAHAAHTANTPAFSRDNNTIEATRLISLITPPTPSPDDPYTGELCPRTSAFATALRSFRHAFHDLTLLAWEDRFSPRASQLQLARAQHLDYEPFVYCKPKLGMPVGLFPQASGSGSGREKEEEYVRGSLGFPVFERRLDENGRVGVVVVRERERLAEEREKVERGEETKRREEERGRKGGRVQRKREWRGWEEMRGAGF